MPTPTMKDQVPTTIKVIDSSQSQQQIDNLAIAEGQMAVFEKSKPNEGQLQWRLLHLNTNGIFDAKSIDEPSTKKFLEDFLSKQKSIVETVQYYTKLKAIAYRLGARQSMSKHQHHRQHVLRPIEKELMDLMLKIKGLKSRLVLNDKSLSGQLDAFSERLERSDTALIPEFGELLGSIASYFNDDQKDKAICDEIKALQKEYGELYLTYEKERKTSRRNNAQRKQEYHQLASAIRGKYQLRDDKKLNDEGLFQRFKKAKKLPLDMLEKVRSLEADFDEIMSKIDNKKAQLADAQKEASTMTGAHKDITTAMQGTVGYARKIENLRQKGLSVSAENLGTVKHEIMTWFKARGFADKDDALMVKIKDYIKEAGSSEDKQSAQVKFFTAIVAAYIVKNSTIDFKSDDLEQLEAQIDTFYQQKKQGTGVKSAEAEISAYLKGCFPSGSWSYNKKPQKVLDMLTTAFAQDGLKLNFDAEFFKSWRGASEGSLLHTYCICADLKTRFDNYAGLETQQAKQVGRGKISQGILEKATNIESNQEQRNAASQGAIEKLNSEIDELVTQAEGVKTVIENEKNTQFQRMVDRVKLNILKYSTCMAFSRYMMERSSSQAFTSKGRKKAMEHLNEIIKATEWKEAARALANCFDEKARDGSAIRDSSFAVILAEQLRDEASGGLLSKETDLSQLMDKFNESFIEDMRVFLDEGQEIQTPNYALNLGNDFFNEMLKDFAGVDINNRNQGAQGPTPQASAVLKAKAQQFKGNQGQVNKSQSCIGQFCNFFNINHNNQRRRETMIETATEVRTKIGNLDESDLSHGSQLQAGQEGNPINPLKNFREEFPDAEAPALQVRPL